MSSEQHGSDTKSPAKTARAAARTKRLTDELRSNLKKRRTQARAHGDDIAAIEPDRGDEGR